MSDRSKAQNFIEAASSGASAAGASGELATLLGAVELLRRSAPPPSKPDPGFASSLRADLLRRHGALTGTEAGRSYSRGRALRWSWLAAPALAAAAALVLVLVFAVFRTPPQPTVALLEMSTGKATVVDPSAKSTVVRKSMKIAVGSTVKVAGGSRAELTFKNRNIARLEAGTTARVDGYSAHTVTIELDRGKVYNRVIAGTRYRVLHSGVTTSAVGTAFDVESLGSGELTNVFEGEVKVRWKGTAPLAVGQGAQAVVTPVDGGFTAEVKPLDLATLDFSWLAYNRDLDRKAGFPLGVLDGLASTPPQGVEPPALVLQPGQSTPTAPATAPATPSSTPVTTTPGSQPTTPQGQPSASLSLSSQGPPVVVKWQGSNVAAADSVGVFRSPGGQVASAGPGSTGAFTDSAVQQGATYTYWIEFVAAGKTIAKSNAVTVTVPAPEPPPPPPPSLEVSLDGYESASAMQLKWGSSGEPLPDTWVVLRAENATPSFPGSTYAEVSGGSAGGSFTDYKVVPGRGITYRIAAVLGGEVICYSNTVIYP